MGSIDGAAAASAFAARRRRTIGSRARADAAALVSDAAVIEAVTQAGDGRTAPSTTRIVLALVGADRVVSSALRTAVASTLERLHREALLVRSDDGGTRRWRLPS